MLDWLNVPCPKCGENLLTYDDYRAWEQTKKNLEMVDFLFGWLVLIPKCFKWMLGRSQAKIESDGKGNIKIEKIKKKK